MRKAPRRDTVEKEIIAALRAAGCHVVAIDGAGIPDLLVTLPGGAPMLAFEVKRPKAKGQTAGKLTDRQEDMWNAHREAVGGVIRSWFIVRTIDDALSIVEELRRY